MAVAITNATWAGSLVNGTSLTITGSGFGAVGNEIPVLFDDFESGTNGANLNTGLWATESANGPSPPTFSNAQSYSGSQCGYADFLSTGGDSAAYKVASYGIEVYASLMFRFRTTASGTTSKGLRAHANDGPNNFTSSPGIYVQEFHNTLHRLELWLSDDLSSFDTENGLGALSEDVWTRLEYHFRMSNPGGATNGIAYSWQDGVQKADFDSATDTGITRNTGVTDEFESILMPFYMGNGVLGEVWYDDVYISKSPARVELATASTWAARTTSEIQVPTVWADGSATITVNQGAYGGSETAYLYVIDSAGLVNANGFAVTFGATSGGAASFSRPSPPRMIGLIRG